jgi:hypothetical protein
MGDGVAAAVGAGQVFGGDGRCFPGRVAADKTGALGKTAGVTEHGDGPQSGASINGTQTPDVGDNSSQRHRQIARFPQLSQRLQRLPQKSLFVRIG